MSNIIVDWMPFVIFAGVIATGVGGILFLVWLVPVVRAENECRVQMQAERDAARAEKAAALAQLKGE